MIQEPLPTFGDMSEELVVRIKGLQEGCAVLEPDTNKRDAVTKDVLQYADGFLNRLDGVKTFIQDGYDDDALSNINFNSANDAADVMQLLHQHMEDPGINTAHGGHLGYIPGGGLYAAALGDYLADVTNKYAGVFYASPGAVRIENALIEWTGKLVGYPDGFGGNITSGGSLANMTGIATARDAKGITGKDYESTVIYTTELAHHSVKKAIVTVGLRECILRYIPMDANFRMDANTLAEQVVKDKAEGVRPFLVVANAGSTDTGSVDPLDEISTITQANDMWLHVDAAYGGYFILLDECKEQMKGLEKADSITLDPHKGLFLPYGTGIILVKEMHHLKNAFAYEANYMQDTTDIEQHVSPAEVSPELSKHFRGLRMWLPLKLYGIEPFKNALTEKLLLTQYFKEQVQMLGFEILCEPDLSVLAYRYIPETGDADAFNKKLTEAMHKDGEIFISSSTIGGKYVLRFACLSFRTHIEHIDKLLGMLERCVKELL